MTGGSNAVDDTTWLEPSVALAERMSLPAVPLPVRSSTVRLLAAERFEPAAVALDVDIWLAAGNGTPIQRSVMSRWVAALCYVAVTELLDAGRAAAAAALASLGVRHAPDDPSVRVVLGLARWDCGHRIDGLAQLVFAVDQYANAGQVAPMLSILTARALSEAGRHELARDVLEPLVATDPRIPLFWDLVDTLDQRVAAATR